ncbi:HbrB-like family protein [Pseudohyphozyma bogoriensis]|nr:HbrB-like family protein [Pseudohyphozyma bogoriensis]
MATQAAKASLGLQPPPSPPSHRSPTPDLPIPRLIHHDHEQRQRSLSDATPRAAARGLPPIDVKLRGAPGTTASGATTPTGLGSRKGSSLAVREVASGRASPALSVGRGAVRQNSNPLNPGRLDSYNSRSVAAALDAGGDGNSSRPLDDVWQSVCVKVLPIFNGEGNRNFVEDLNELVTTHVQRTIARCQNQNRSRSSQPIDTATLVTALLIADLTELISIGCLTLTSKLTPSDALTDEKFLARLNELWLFFWTGILPHLESVFWIFRCDERLKANVVGGGTRDGRRLREEGRIDVRKLALIGFRDHLILPHITRITLLFSELYESRPSSRAPSPPSQTSGNSPQRHRTQPSYASNASTLVPEASATTNSLHPAGAGATLRPPPGATSLPSASQAANARRRQMVAVCASLLTDDARQHELDELLRIMRSGVGEASPAVGSGSEAWPGAQNSRDSPPRTPDMSHHPSSYYGAEVMQSPEVASIHQHQRARASTMNSLDEEQASDAATPMASSKPKRRGFLPRIGRSRSGSTVMTATELKRGNSGHGSGHWSGRGEESEGTGGSELER